MADGTANKTARELQPTDPREPPDYRGQQGCLRALETLDEEYDIDDTNVD